MTKSMIIAGVGGQGTLLASKLLGNLFLSQGYDVKVSEVHGMSQRGGSVVTYVPLNCWRPPAGPPASKKAAPLSPTPSRSFPCR